MKPELEFSRLWPQVIGSAALGAAAMFVFDPVRGRRRRAIARDKAFSFLCDGRDAIAAAARDLRYRAQGIQAQARRRLRSQPVTDDLLLIERVRAKLGRVVSHPHAIQVGAESGRIHLSGPILAGEVLPLLQTVRGVPGVRDIEEHLVAHTTADSVPSLQGTSRRFTTRGAINRQDWSPALCLVAMTAGTLLAIYGLRTKSVIGAALASVGVSAVVTASTRRHRSGRSPPLSNPRRSSVPM